MVTDCDCIGLGSYWVSYTIENSSLWTSSFPEVSFDTATHYLHSLVFEMSFWLQNSRFSLVFMIALFFAVLLITLWPANYNSLLLFIPLSLSSLPSLSLSIFFFSVSVSLCLCLSLSLSLSISLSLSLSLCLSVCLSLSPPSPLSLSCYCSILVHLSYILLLVSQEGVLMPSSLTR